MSENQARLALEALLWELPVWLTDSEVVNSDDCPNEFRVVIPKNVRKVGNALIDLRESLGV